MKHSAFIRIQETRTYLRLTWYPNQIRDLVVSMEVQKLSVWKRRVNHSSLHLSLLAAKSLMFLLQWIHPELAETPVQGARPDQNLIHVNQSRERVVLFGFQRNYSNVPVDMVHLNYLMEATQQLIANERLQLFWGKGAPAFEVQGYHPVFRWSRNETVVCLIWKLNENLE